VAKKSVPKVVQASTAVAECVRARRCFIQLSRSNRIFASWHQSPFKPLSSHSQQFRRRKLNEYNKKDGSPNIGVQLVGCARSTDSWLAIVRVRVTRVLLVAADVDCEQKRLLTRTRDVDVDAEIERCAAVLAHSLCLPGKCVLSLKRPK